jgi:(+)-trans-carveol dehydrogenase
MTWAPPARLEGKVAFVTGAARGQGRGHAVRLAEEGADIVAVDIVSQIDTVPFPMATPDDLAETVKEVETLDRRIVASQADVRNYGGLKAALDDGVAKLGRLDIVAANAGIVSFGTAEELTEQAWRDVIDVNLTGVWHTGQGSHPPPARLAAARSSSPAPEPASREHRTSRTMWRPSTASSG